MADYTMTKGMNDWNTVYNNLQQAIMNNKAAWTNTGITFLNGCSQGTDQQFKYSLTTIGNTRIFQIKGTLKFPDLKMGQSIECLQVPANLFTGISNDFIGLVNMNPIWSDSWLNFKLSDPATGKMKVINTSNSDITNGGAITSGQKFIVAVVLF